MNRLAARVISLATVALLIRVSVFGQSTPQAKGPLLADLRHAYAMEYFDPDTHMALAKYHHDRGNRLLAFYILEAARRSRFEEKVFDVAFAKVFLGTMPFDNSKEAEEKLLAKHQRDPKNAEGLFRLADIYIAREEWSRAKPFLTKLIALKPEEYANYVALAEVYRRENDKQRAIDIVESFFKKYPESVEAFTRKTAPLMRTAPEKAKALLEEALRKHPNNASFLFNQAILLQDRGKLEGAEAMFERAAKAGKDNAQIQGSVGRFFLRAKPNEAKALYYYLNVYFLDPHFNDTEYADSRIRTLNHNAGTAFVRKAEKEGKKLEDLLTHENPVVVDLVLAKLSKPWNESKVRYSLDALGHDDPNIRWQATGILMENAGQSLDTVIPSLLAGQDLRKRGLACYLAVNRWKDKGVEMIRPMLREKCQLIRFDAVSALWEHGGELGKKYVRGHRATETNPWLRDLIDSFDKKE